MGYTDNATSSSVRASVLAGYDFTMSKNVEQWCNTVLAGTYPNLKILPKDGSEVTTNLLGMQVPAGWMCGDQGWIGCKQMQSGWFSGVKYTCEHRFGSQASGNDM